MFRNWNYSAVQEMRKFLRLVLLVGFALLPLSAPAQAQTLEGLAVREELRLVAATNVPGPRGFLSVCHHTRTRTILGMGYWARSLGYVLSDRRCEGLDYYRMPLTDRGDVPRELIAAGVPPEPGLSLNEMMRGFFWLYVLPLAAYIGATAGRILRSRLPQKSRAELRRDVLGMEEGPLFRLIDAMCHAAAADGAADTTAIRQITELAQELTGLDVQEEHVIYAVNHRDALQYGFEFRRFGKGLTPEQKAVVLQGVRTVLNDQGGLTRAEEVFLNRIGRALKVKRPGRVETGVQQAAAA